MVRSAVQDVIREEVAARGGEPAGSLLAAGLGSAAVVHLVSALEDRFDVDLDVEALFTGPLTVEHLELQVMEALGQGAAALPRPRPRQPAPALDVPLVGGGRWVLADQHPDLFSLVVFYRGVHCPMCREHVRDLDAHVPALAAAGVTSVVAVSGDDVDRARRAVDEWELANVRVGYGLPVTAMRAWGLYVSRAIKEGQPNRFSEPGTFLVRPDGTLYAAVQTSMPFLRPRFADVLETVTWIGANDYPARGEL